MRRKDLQVAEGDAVGQGEGTLSLDDVVDAVVGVWYHSFAREYDY